MKKCSVFQSPRVFNIQPGRRLANQVRDEKRTLDPRRPNFTRAKRYLRQPENPVSDSQKILLRKVSALIWVKNWLRKLTALQLVWVKNWLRNFLINLGSSWFFLSEIAWMIRWKSGWVQDLHTYKMIARMCWRVQFVPRPVLRKTYSSISNDLKQEFSRVAWTSLGNCIKFSRELQKVHLEVLSLLQTIVITIIKL